MHLQEMYARIEHILLNTAMLWRLWLESMYLFATYSNKFHIIRTKLGEESVYLIKSYFEKRARRFFRNTATLWYCSYKLGFSWISLPSYPVISARRLLNAGSSAKILPFSSCKVSYNFTYAGTTASKASDLFRFLHKYNNFPSKSQYIKITKSR